MSFDFSTLITDRSPEDLQALRDLLATPMADWTAAQLAQFNQAVSKGAYNYTDLNRVIAAMDDLNERLTAAGYMTGYQRIVVPHQGNGGSDILPDGYTQLEYIESTGTQYIDTGFVPNQDSRVYLKVMPMSAAETGDGSGFIPYGAGISNTSKAFECYSSLGQYEFNYDGQYSFVGSASVGSVLEIDHNKNIVSLCSNGEKQNINFTYATFSCPYTLTLFALHRASILRGLLRLYSCQIYDNGTITRHFVPCKNPDEEIGLYDLVDGEFYPNAGAGVFSAGPEVINPQPDPELDPYTWYESDVPTQSQLTRYLDNVSKLRNILTLPENTIDAPEDMEGFTLQEANGIETILEIINTYLVAIESIILSAGLSWAISGGPNFYFAI